MMRTRFPGKWLIGLVLVAAAASELRAQNISTLVTKRTLTAEDNATIQLWVTKRAQTLSNGDEKDIKNVEDDITKLVTAAKPSTAFAGAFAGQCGEQMGNVTRQSGDPLDQQRGAAAVRILTMLDRAETATALAGALQSSHPAVRFTAAKAIQRLHKQLTDENDVESVLNALGEAGASEQSALVLPEIYRAIDFKTWAQNPKFGNMMAGALARLFSGRAGRLAQGARDESVDLVGLNAAATVVPSAGATNRKQLARAVLALMVQAVERHLDDQTNDASRTALVPLISKEQDIVSRLLQAGGVTPPSDSIPAMLRGAKPNAKTVRDALGKWQAAVDGL